MRGRMALLGDGMNATINIRDLVANAEPHKTRLHSVEWSHDQWQELGGSYPWVGSAVNNLSAEDERRVSRGSLMDLAARAGSPYSVIAARHLLVATLVWGWGKSGPFRVKELIQATNSDAGGRRLARIASTAAMDAETAYGDDLFDERGRARLRRLGVAFGTKFLYFASFAGEPDVRPLIYDMRVCKALRRCSDYASRLRSSGIEHPPSDPSHLRTKEYMTYLRFAYEIHPSSPDLVELALFQEGGA
jgi:hypothetical protein